MKKNFKQKINTNGFKQNPENINRKGAPPKLLNQTIAELKALGFERVSKNSILELYEILLNCNKNTLDILAAEDNNSTVVNVIVKQLLSPRAYDIINDILDRAHGRAIQQTEVKVNESVRIFIEPDPEIQSEIE